MSIYQMDWCTFIEESLDFLAGHRALCPKGVMPYRRYAGSGRGRGYLACCWSVLIWPPPAHGPGLMDLGPWAGARA